jgi:3-deoxy-7-phosphoheptulonate synthase
LEQIRIADDVVNSRNVNKDLKGFIKGLMIESYIEDGAGKAENHLYGQSITDPCLGWEKTENLILKIADNLK